MKNASAGRIRRIPGPWIATLALLAAAPAHADPQTGLEAGLILRHSELEWETQGRSIDAEVSRLGLALWEGAGPWLRLGLSGGPLRASQDDNPATAGMELSGQYLALSADIPLLSTRLLALTLGGSLSYNRAEGDRDSQDVKLTWYEGRGELAATLKLSSLYLSGGAFGLIIDGDETASGPLTYTRDFEAAESAGGFLAADYWVDPTGRVGIRGEFGASQGFELQFTRRF